MQQSTSVVSTMVWGNRQTSIVLTYPTLTINLSYTDVQQMHFVTSSLLLQLNFAWFLTKNTNGSFFPLSSMQKSETKHESFACISRESKSFIQNIEGHLSTSRGYQEASARVSTAVYTSCAIWYRRDICGI